jgi:sugar phosphate isomerase/epimerase
MYTRRELGIFALAALPAVEALGAVNSTFKHVHIGAQTYSYRTVPNVEQIIKDMAQTGIGLAELMSNHAEALAGAPPAPPAPPGRGGGGGRGQMTDEQRAAFQAAQKARAEEMAAWRNTVSMDRFKEVRKKFNDAGIKVPLLCYNMNERTLDDEIEYAFTVAKALGVKAITTSTQITVAKRIAPFADKHKMMVGFHGHDQTDNPNEFAKPENFETAMGYSKYHGINLDIGHFTAANYDPLPYLKEHHDRITNLHIKDRKKNHGANVPWGEGDTPIKETLQLVSKERYKFPVNIEFEYRVPEGSDLNTEMAKCLKYCKDALA